MLILFNRLLTKEHISIQKVEMEKCYLHLACENNHDEIILILCMIFNHLFTVFCFIDHKLYKVVCVFTFMWLLCESHMHKGKVEQMWKWVMNLAMIQWECVSNTKKEWSLTIKLKILKLCFYDVNCDFWWSMVYHEFFNF
jgi:hypothetical protein